MRTLQITNAGEDTGKKGTLLHCWWECKLVQLLWKTAWRCLKKLTIELPYDPAFPLMGIYPKERKHSEKITCMPLLQHCF